MGKLIFVITFFSAGFCFGHAYYFAFAEMQYNENKKRFEISIRATGHDIEEYMEHINQPIDRLEKCIGNPLHEQKLAKTIKKHFVITMDETPIILDFVGMEVNKKDEAIFYLVSREMEQPNEITITFDLLMKYFEEQQNKLTIFNKTGKEYLTFLNHRSTRKYKFNKEDE